MSDGPKTDRSLRADNRARHDGKITGASAQPVRTFTPDEIAQMTNDPTRRINVTERDEQERTLVVRYEDALTFDQQKEEVRRLNSMMLARIGAKLIARGADDDTILGLLAKCSTIAKQWSAEERQAGGNQSTEEPSASDLMKRGHRIAD